MPITELIDSEEQRNAGDNKKATEQHKQQSNMLGFKTQLHLDFNQSGAQEKPCFQESYISHHRLSSSLHPWQEHFLGLGHKQSSNGGSVLG